MAAVAHGSQGRASRDRAAAVSARSCPSDLELSRALTTGADAELAMHVASCAPCRDAWDGFTAAIHQARELPAEIPSASHREDVRTALLAEATRGTAVRRRVRWVVPALALAAAAAVAVQLARPVPVSEPRRVVARGVVHPHVGARYALSSPPDEIVQLHDGVIDIHVDPLGPGERFRVVVGHDEVEVRGTAFEVVAVDDKLVEVRVVHGRVEVRRVGESLIALGAGEVWHVPVAAATKDPDRVVIAPAPSPSRPASPHQPPPHRSTSSRVRESTMPDAPSATLPAVANNPDEAAFVGAWNAMRRNDFSAAAAAFARVLAVSPDGPLSEDASYWFAVSTARIPQPINAIAAFRAFLDQYPHSRRTGEASAVLGWLLVDAGDRTEAKRRFEAATTDHSTEVRASARAGLDELARP